MRTHVALLLLLLLACPARALWLNEVLANPAGSEYEDEFLELVQNDSLALELAGLLISDGSATDELVAWNGGPTLLAPGALALILDPGHQGGYLDDLPEQTLLLTVSDGSLGSGGLSNSNSEMVSLLAADGLLLDRIATRPVLPEGLSLERRWEGAACDSCWLPGRQPGGSPGRPNSVRRRRDELELRGWSGQGLRLLAVGDAGFSGRLGLSVGLAPCRDTLQAELRLARGDSLLIPWPSLRMPGWNPLRAEARPWNGEEQLLLDSQGWRDPQPGELGIEAIQPSTPDWLQLRVSGCPCRLDGMRLTGRSFSLALQGVVPAGGRLLLGSVSARCPVEQQDTRSLALAQEGAVDLWSPAGQELDSAHWPPPDGSGRPWRRVDPARPGDDPTNWLADEALAPGCVPSILPTAPAHTSDWWLSTTRLDPSRGLEGMLVVEAGDRVASPWSFEVWTLEGQRLFGCKVYGRRLVWTGLDGSGHPLEPGLVLVRLLAREGEELHPLVLRPD